MKGHLRIWIYSIVLIGTVLMLTNSCKKVDETIEPGTVKDIDGNVYTTVTIGTQVWMVENLKTTRYRNGEPILNVTDNHVWSDLTPGGAYCNYNNVVAIGTKYGKLYNWYAVNDSRNIAPTGWHIPSDVEWNTLENYISDIVGPSGYSAMALAARNYWINFDDGPNDVSGDLTKNNSSGFNALPASFRRENGEFPTLGGIAVWWTSTESKTETAINRLRLHDICEGLGIGNHNKRMGCSVRCLKD